MKSLECIPPIHDISTTPRKNLPYLPYPDDIDKLSTLPCFNYLILRSIYFDEYQDGGQSLLESITSLRFLKKIYFDCCESLEPKFILQLAESKSLEEIILFNPISKNDNLAKEWHTAIGKLREKLPDCRILSNT